MKFGVITFPGSNCDQDMLYVLRDLLGQQVEQLWHKNDSINACDFVILPGGFSYGDYLRSGAIAQFSPIMKAVKAHAEKGGYVLGVCNGFQILTESNLLPGALLHNNNRKFICKNTYIKAQTNESIITTSLSLNEALKIPIAHGEGKYFADSESIKKLNDNNQVLFRYCDEKGNSNEESNPNGSLENIAGVCNIGRNVFGMMPHPERAADAELGNTDGRKLFESILSVVERVF
jgi:phosphoribosylformylglycinamidine synthase I